MGRDNESSKTAAADNEDGTRAEGACDEELKKGAEETSTTSLRL
jgi:hypothetical protein